MKGNLLKKIGAVATTVAMIASVSVTGFAAGVVYNTGAEGDQDITGKPIMATETTTKGIYEVKIPYVSEVPNTIGVTMLAYADANHTNLTNDDKSYEEGMKIVGIEQFNAGDTTNKIGVDGTGTFTFLVDTNALADGEEEWNATDKTGVIRMNKGERGVVLLSGDAASATGYLFQVGKAAATVKVDKGGSPVTEILEEKGWTGAGADYIKDIITTGSYKVKLGDAVADAAKVTVEAKGAEYDDTNWQAQTVVYTVSVNDDSYDITPAEITVKYAADTWNATAVKAGNLEFPKADVANGDLAATVKSKISAVTLVSDKGEAEVAIPADKLEVTFAGTFAADANENKAYDVTVKVLEGQYDRFVVGAAGVQGDYRIVVTAQDTREEITSVTFGAANALSIENAVAPEDLAGILAKVKEHVEAGGVKVNGKADYPVASLTYATTDTYTKPTGSDAATVTYTVTAPANVTIAGYKWKAEAQATTLKVTVTVKGAGPDMSAWQKGDINKDGFITVADWGVLANHVKGGAQINAEDARSIKSADVNNDGFVTVADWGVLANHVKGGAQITQIPHNEWK